MIKKSINRIRVLLAEKDRANKWRAKQLDVTSGMISKRCESAGGGCYGIAYHTRTS